ncbi:MAG: hypothetical protein JWN49_378 [Parcubacteria group bacterium]|nr:hypothetical protein [Parcubacteria group bacterium]
MAGVTFEEEVSSPSHAYAAPSGAKSITKWLVAKGFAKTESGANKLLIGFSIASIVIAMGLFLFAPKEKVTPNSAADRARLEASTPLSPLIHR